MSKKKGNAADLAPSRQEKKGIGQYILGFFLLLYTLFCFLPVLLVFIAAFTDESAILDNGFSYFLRSILSRCTVRFEIWSSVTDLICSYNFCYGIRYFLRSDGYEYVCLLH